MRTSNTMNRIIPATVVFALVVSCPIATQQTTKGQDRPASGDPKFAIERLGLALRDPSIRNDREQLASLVWRIWNFKPWTPEHVNQIAPYIELEIDMPAIKAERGPLPPGGRGYADLHPFYAIARDVGLESVPYLIRELAVSD